jgi:hypothetical protein
MNTSPVIIAGLGLAFSVLGVGFAFVPLRRALASQDWSTALGTIVSSRVERLSTSDGPLFQLAVVYRYCVGSCDYTGREISTASVQYGTKRSAERRLQNYPIGAPVTVRYNPANPAQALLKPGINAPTVALGLAFLASLFFFAAQLIRALA